MGESVQCEMVKSFTSIGDASCSQCNANKRCPVYLALEQAQQNADFGAQSEAAAILREAELQAELDRVRGAVRLKCTSSHCNILMGSDDDCGQTGCPLYPHRDPEGRR